MLTNAQLVGVIVNFERRDGFLIVCGGHEIVNLFESIYLFCKYYFNFDILIKPKNICLQKELVIITINT